MAFFSLWNSTWWHSPFSKLTYTGGTHHQGPFKCPTSRITSHTDCWWGSHTSLCLYPSTAGRRCSWQQWRVHSFSLGNWPTRMWMAPPRQDLHFTLCPVCASLYGGLLFITRTTTFLMYRPMFYCGSMMIVFFCLYLSWYVCKFMFHVSSISIIVIDGLWTSLNSYSTQDHRKKNMHIRNLSHNL